LGEAAFKELVSRLRRALRLAGLHAEYFYGEAGLGAAWRDFLAQVVVMPRRAGCRPGCLSQSGLTNALVSRTAERFGQDGSFRSHHFRHCLASVLPLVVPEHPELASQLLAISHQTAARHYDRSSAVLAFRRYHAVLDAERERHRR
jgi:hypothetical protein